MAFLIDAVHLQRNSTKFLLFAHLKTSNWHLIENLLIEEIEFVHQAESQVF